jgi:dolichyl-phosphate-mannose--protein O-mannosyl transferase
MTMTNLLLKFAVLLVSISNLLAQDAVTCGSVVKLINKDTNFHLHSHAIAWGSGSGQQSVTCTSSQNDNGSLWLVKESTRESAACEIATPIACGSMIRMEHVSTGKNLHSHLFKAPLSGNQEVSGFGDSGSGDTGDNWIVECDGGQKVWNRGVPVYFKHVDTGKYLYTADGAKFNQQNCGGGCPIMVRFLWRVVIKIC